MRLGVKKRGTMIQPHDTTSEQQNQQKRLQK
jgi:hypothetical protein